MQNSRMVRPARNTRDEDADERTPGEPPDQVGERPGTRPLIELLVRKQTEGHLRQTGKVITHRIDERLQDERGRTEHENEEHQQDRDDHVQVGQYLDALVDTGGGRQHIADEQRAHDGERDIHGQACTEHGIQPATHLQRAHGQRAGETEHDGQHAEHVGQNAEGRTCLARKQHSDRGGDRRPQPPSEREIGDDQRTDTVDGPGVETPVQIRDDHGGTRSGGCFTRHAGWIVVVIHRLGHAPEQQACPHAAGEQHRDPGGRVELGTFVVTAEAHVAVRAEGKISGENDEAGTKQQPEPADVRQQIIGDVSEPRRPSHRDRTSPRSRFRRRSPAI